MTISLEEARDRTRRAERLRPRRLFIWAQVRYLTKTMPGLIGVVVFASLLAAFSEGAILAILAQSGLLLVQHTSRVRIELGPLHVRASLGELLAVGGTLAILRLALQSVIAYVPARIQDNTQAWMRSDVFAAFTQAAWADQSRDKEGHLQELVTNHVGQAAQSYTNAGQLIVSLVTFLVLVASALVLNPLAAVAVLVIAAALLMLLRPLGTVGAGHGRALSQAWLGFAGGVNEAVRIAEETHVFGAEASQRQRIDQLIATMRRPNVHMQWLSGFVPGAYQSLIYLMLILGLLGLYESGTGHIASLGAVVLLLVRSGAYGQQTQSCIQTLRQTQPYVERLQEAERRYEESIPPGGLRPLDRVRTISFSQVTYAYEGREPALTDVSFDVLCGETIGIIGPSGAGKSTLVQILLGLRAPASGGYLVNGVAASEFRREDWRRLVAYVPQEPRLLHASVSDNIRFFRSVSQEAVEQAARLAGIHNDILSWPMQYETVVGPRADAISGGQQQRICLARALAANPEVLVLDEPTSALDPAAEQLIQDSLLGLKHKLTLFIVAHRMSTLDICERVMVILDGRLDACDTIEALRSKNAYYRSAISGPDRGTLQVRATAASP